MNLMAEFSSSRPVALLASKPPVMWQVLDSLWLKLIKEQNLTTEEKDRYMDDVRVFTLALKPG